MELLARVIRHRLIVGRAKFRTHLYKERLLFDCGNRAALLNVEPRITNTQAERQHLHGNPTLFQNFVSHVDTNQKIQSQGLKNLPTHSKGKEEKDE